MIQEWRIRVHKYFKKSFSFLKIVSDIIKIRENKYLYSMKCHPV